MKKPEADQLVINTFTHEFSEEQFTNFIRNLLPGLEAPSTRTVPNAQLPQGFREHVYNYTRVGTYHDPQGDVLDVVIVKLKNQGSLDRARTRQRNLMAHYLNRREKDAVLVAYITDDPSDWRFSYVKLAFQTEITDQGKVRVNQEYTPARRYSFLVGQHEPNHTAQKQLGDLLILEGKPTLEQIEAAFNIESVTKEFFEDYKKLFLMIKENLDRIVETKPQVQAEFERCEIDTANFAKKLLGQIVFLYFLQKKGWLGVAEGKAWGTGDKKFLSNLFEQNKDRNFFDEILEPFFYEALAMERKGDFYPALQCKVPFLNGGLFEPLNGYDWEHTLIGLDNKDFEEIFRVFNLYNFTVREDEPLEKEVAVDPEMLGKVFENLLEFKDRKSKGAFYTPREIVHYMCQESLINYLDAALNQKEKSLAKEDGIQSDLFGNKPDHQMVIKEKVYQELIPLADIETFIREGEISIERDQAREEGKLGDDDYGLPESIRNYAKEIDFALADVKICDPAIGSGAFPVGMMTEIVRARQVLTAYLPNQRNRDSYSFKWHCIENSLYGVDIDASAVDIAKLRLWLSLIVDEESYDEIRPLPNLDYRIVCGNSLLSVQKDLFNFSLYPELEQKKIQYFSTTSPKNKNVLRREIEGLIYQLTNGKTLFDFEVYFSEIFSKNKGFDVIIANPPYVRVDEIKKELKKIYRDKYQVVYGKYDIYYLFFELGFRLGAGNGILSYITPNKFCAATSAEKLRNLIMTQISQGEIISVSHLNVFSDASNYPVLSFFKTSQNGIKQPYIEVRQVVSLDNLWESTQKKYCLPVSSFRQFPYSIIPINIEEEEVLLILRLIKDHACIEKYINFSEGLRIPQGFERKQTSDYHIVKQYQFSKWSEIEKGTYISSNNLKKVISKDATRFKIAQVEKILIAEDGLSISATMDASGSIPQGGLYFGASLSVLNNWVILAILNSKLLSALYKYLFAGMHMGGGYMRYRSSFLEKLPIPIVNEFFSQNLSTLARHRINSHEETTNIQLEEKIDKLVYELYCLTEKEIQIIESNVKI